METYEGAVLGGGLAGCAAAVTAARHGCRTLLLEQAGSLGGAAVRCLVNPFMPFFTTVEEQGQKKRLNLSDGLFTEIRDRLSAYGALKGLFMKSI